MSKNFPHNKPVLDEIFLDYVNNYLTVEKWSEHYGISAKNGRELLIALQAIYDDQFEEEK